jgi:NitT/TauT family transport system substrate-binding protein
VIRVENRIVLLVDEIHALRNLPVVLAEQLGYLQDGHLDVTLMNIRYDITHRELLAAGRVDAVMAYYHHNFAYRSVGLNTRSVVTLGITAGIKVLVADHARSAVGSATDLGGHRVICGGIKSAKSTVASWLTANGGAGVDGFTRLPTIGREGNAALLRSGAADVIVVPANEAEYYESAGVASVLADLSDPASTERTLGTLCPTSTVFMADDRIAERPDIAQHLAAVFVRTLRYMNTRSAEDLAELVPETVRGKDPATYLRSVKAVAGMFAGDGTMPEEGVAREAEVLQAMHEPYRAVPMAATYTDEFARRALADAAASAA